MSDGPYTIRRDDFHDIENWTIDGPTLPDAKVAHCYATETAAQRDADVLNAAYSAGRASAAAEREGMVKALERIAEHPHNSYEGVEGGMYGIGVVDGHRCAAQIAKDALAALRDAGQGVGGQEERNGR